MALQTTDAATDLPGAMAELALAPTQPAATAAGQRHSEHGAISTRPRAPSSTSGANARPRRAPVEITRRKVDCTGISRDALNVTSNRGGDHDMDVFAELRKENCDRFGGWQDCTAHLLELGTLLDEARLVERAIVIARLNESPRLCETACAFFNELQAEAGNMRQWPVEKNARTEALADQLIMHAWGRYLQQRFLTSTSEAAHHSRPMAALEAVAKLAGCRPAGCDVVLSQNETTRDQVVFGTTLLLALARTNGLYRAVFETSVDGAEMCPALQPISRIDALFRPKLLVGLRYEERETALVVNPLPQLPGGNNIRFDGVCFRGAADLSFSQNQTVLDAAAPYALPGACGPLAIAPDSVDRRHPIGTIKHSLRSVLGLLANHEIASSPEADGYEGLYLASGLEKAIRQWNEEPVHDRVHPGWLAALHLAYSSGVEPLSIPQLLALWKTDLWPRYKTTLDRFIRTPGGQSDWLREQLTILPPLREEPSDVALIAWIDFLRDDLPLQIESAEAVGDSAEAQRLGEWRLPWPETSLVFYRTPAEHFHIIATHFIDRMEALWVESNLWKVDAAAQAAACGDHVGFNSNTLWLGELSTEDSDDDPLALPIAQLGGDTKTQGLRSAMQRFRNRLLNHPALRAHAAETLRDEQTPRSSISLRARALSLTDDTRHAVPTTAHVFSVGTLLGMLPIVGTAQTFYRDLKHGEIINSIIDGVELYLQVTDIYGTAANVLFSEEVAASLESEAVQLAEDDLRDVSLAEEGRIARIVRRGAVFREIEPATGAILDNAVVAFDGQRLQRIILRELQDVLLPVARRFTVRMAEKFVREQHAKYVDRNERFREQFDKRFEFDERSPESLREAALRAYASFHEGSMTFRYLLSAGRDDGRRWVIGEGRVFRTTFADHNAMGESRIDLATANDAEKATYMAATGLQPTPYRRALLHELVHAMTDLPDTAFDTYLKQQKVAVRRLNSFLNMQSQPAASDSIMSNVRKRRRRALQHTLEGARHVIREAYEGMAEQRGPVVYLVDRIGQECHEGWEERVMYLADNEGDEARLNLMHQHRADATERMHGENDLLDRIWLDNLEITEHMPFEKKLLVRERDVAREWRQFVDTLKSRPGILREKEMDRYLRTPIFSVAADVQAQLAALIEKAARRSPTFKVLIGLWHAMSRGTEVWQFTMHGSETAADNPASNLIDVSTGRFITTGIGAKPASLERQAISGMVASLLHASGFQRPDEALHGRRWLGTALEQRVLDELFDQEPMRVNGATFTEKTRSVAHDTTVSLLRRAALLEDRYVEAWISPRPPVEATRGSSTSA